MYTYTYRHSYRSWGEGAHEEAHIRVYVCIHVYSYQTCAKAPMRKLMPSDVYAYLRRYVMVRHMPRYVYMFMSNM